MSTPEGLVKTKIKKVLASFGPELYALWPVSNGMGAPTLDCLGWYRGTAFAIEAKAAGKKPTPRQNITIAAMRAAGGKVFVIDGEASITELLMWLGAVRHK